MQITSIEKETLQTIRESNPEDARKLIELLERHKEKNITPLRDLTEALIDILFFSGVIHEERKKEKIYGEDEIYRYFEGIFDT